MQSKMTLFTNIETLRQSERKINLYSDIDAILELDTNKMSAIMQDSRNISTTNIIARNRNNREKLPTL